MKYINADALKKQVENPYTEYPIMIQIRKTLKDFIDDAPSIDIVRCKECKRRYRSGYRGDEYWVCDFMDTKIKDDDFCSYGVRETNTTAEEKLTPIRDYMVHGEREGE